MCGIAGIVSRDDGAPSLDALARMRASLSPRGPDGQGAFAHGGVALGHRRLKIIDLSEAGRQPMEDPELGLSIAFNGCIYNHKELRAELEAKGRRFFSTSDTEVILKAFHEWGEDCVHRLQGMFAFAIVERDSGRVTLARDRLGIKPLYWAEVDGEFRFASTLPAILAGGGVDTSIDPVALNFYMNFHAVVPPPWTILKGVRKLPPATVMTIAPDGARQERVYWRLSFAPHAGDDRLSADDWRAMTHDMLRTAVRRRLVADVPVGVLLSGGVDSSLIVGLLAEEGQTGLKTFSVGFESVGGEEGDEFRFSDIIARRFKTDHRQIRVNSRTRLLPELPACVRAMAEPMVSHDVIGFFLLSEEVAKHVKVVQSGQGADEVFAGYHWYPPLSATNNAVDAYLQGFRDRSHSELAGVLTPEFRTDDHAGDFVAAQFAETDTTDDVAKALSLDTRVMLVDDPVKRVDNMTMAWGLEARVPFLDHELVELAARIPSSLKLAQHGKGILKDVARDVIPSEVIDRPKGYFPVPALKYLEGDVLAFVRDVLDAPAARDRGVFERSHVDALLNAPNDHITNLGGSKLWQIALLELWLQERGV